MARSLPIFLLALTVVLGATPGRAADGDSEVAAQIVDDGKGIYTVRGGFSIPAPTSHAWSVLADYDGLSRFIPAMQSRVVKRDGCGHFTVEQESTIYVLAIPKRTRVLLQVEEQLLQNRIEFEDAAHDDFELYRGAWQLEKLEGGTRISYSTSAKPRFMPPLVGRAIMLDTVRGLLRDLRKEMLRRPMALGAPRA